MASKKKQKPSSSEERVYEPVFVKDKYVTFVPVTYGDTQDGYEDVDATGETTESTRSSTSSYSHRSSRSSHGHRSSRSSDDPRSSRSSHGDRSSRSSDDPRSSRSSHGDRSSRSSHDPRSSRSSHGDRSSRSSHGRKPSDDGYEDVDARMQGEWHRQSEVWKSTLGELNLLREKHPHKLVKTLKHVCVCEDEHFLIGKGKFAKVYLGLKNDGQEVAVKQIVSNNSEWKKRMETEVNILVTLEPHPNIVSYKLTEWPSSTSCYIVTELCEYSLEKWLKHESVKKQSVEEWNGKVPGLWKGVVSGLNHLHTHEPKYLHRDLKPPNVLVVFHNSETRLKLADFGISCMLMDDQTTHLTMVAGTKGWMAAEVITHDKKEIFYYKDTTDIQICGMLLYYIASRGVHPFHHESLHYQDKNIVEKKHDLSALDNQHVGLDLVRSMLEPKPKDRPSTTVVLRHPAFWSEEKQCKLLTAVGKEPEVADSHEPEHQGSVVRQDIEGTKGSDWDALRKKMERGFDETNETDAKFLTRFKRAGYVESVCNLLVTMRKLHNKFEELSPRAKAMLGNTCYPYKFFDKELPWLFLHIYKVIKKSATTDDDWTKREKLMDFFPS